MDTGITKYFTIDSSLIEDYDLIKNNLKIFFLHIGEKYKWKLVDSSNTIIEFKTKFDWIWGNQEHILINFSNRNIKIKSFDPIGKSPWTEKVEERNNKNCDIVINEIPKIINTYLNSEIEKNRVLEKNRKRQQLEEIEKKRIENLNSKQTNYLFELDKNNDGLIDLVDIETFNKIISKNQNTIIGIDKGFVQKFVKISLYLKTKKSNIQKIFESLRDTKNESELNELVNLLKNQIHTYELLLYHSINMVTSLIKNDLITFYEIYESFDLLGVFNSNWENEVSTKLSNIEDGIKDLMYSINEMEIRLIESIENLTYITQDSFHDLTVSVEKQLSDINSSLNLNTLINGIQTYQMYRINQNIKRLN